MNNTAHTQVAHKTQAHNGQALRFFAQAETLQETYAFMELGTRND